MFELAWPWAFLLLPLPWLAAWWLKAAPMGGGLRLPYRALPLAGLRAAGSSVARARSLAALAVWLLLLAALARPLEIGEIAQEPRSGRDLLLAVDVSGSMRIADMQLGGRAVDRLTAVKVIAGDFLQRRVGDRVGLILFGTQAYLLTPLTLDRKSTRTQLEEAEIGLAGRDTAIGDAIGLAVKRLRERPEAQRVLVLLTDGVNTAGALTPDKAAQMAEQSKVRVYTIAIGADAMQVDGFFGSRTVNPSAEIDEALLRRVAERTGAEFYRARDTAQLATIYRAIDKLEAVAQEGKKLRLVSELFYLPLALALALTAATLLLATRTESPNLGGVRA